MYGWYGGFEAEKKPGSYKYDTAKSPYLDKLSKTDIEEDRSYLSKKTPNLDLVDPKGKKISSDSENPIEIVIDGTGSMQHWPAEIFDRLPLLYKTLVQYKEDVDVGLSLVGDANYDKWSLQVAPFGKGITLDDHLKAVHAEGGGGPGIRESYELFAYFANNHIETPNAISPMMFLMGDEMFYEQLDPKHVKNIIGDTVQGPIDSMELFHDLSQKFDIYLLRKPYSGKDSKIEGQWAEAIGAQRIVRVDDPERIMDQVMAITATRWGQADDFVLNMESRQDSGKVYEVMESIKAATEVDMTMKSKVDTGAVEKSTSLLEDS